MFSVSVAIPCCLITMVIEYITINDTFSLYSVFEKYHLSILIYDTVVLTYKGRSADTPFFVKRKEWCSACVIGRGP
jgi:hypothetical protein